jgi:hypothetical protein
MAFTLEHRRRLSLAVKKIHAAKPKEERVEKARRMAIAANAKRTPEERRASALHAVQARWKRYYERMKSEAA